MKRIVGLSVPIFDLSGGRTVRILPTAYEGLNKGERRATRTATLDGAAVVYDAGFADADRTLEVQTRDSLAAAFFAYLVQTYNLIKISTDTGKYSAVPKRWAEENGIATLEALVMEKLS